MINLGGMMKHISVIGSCNMDLVVEVDRRPMPGETVLGNKMVLSPGGKGANQAIAAARLGAKVYMVGCVGNDAYGQMLKKAMEDSNVNTDYVYVLDNVHTGTAHITVSNGENTIIVIKGANSEVSQKHIEEAWKTISASDIVLLQHEISKETIDYVIKRCYEENIPVLLNPAPYMDVPEEWIKKVKYITPNEHEAALMFKGYTRNEILTSNNGKVIMTAGKEGVFYGENNSIINISGFDVKAVDTTGAGDTFNGAFAVARSEGKNMKESIRFANAAAALSVTKFGAQSGMPYRKDVEELLKCKK